MDGNKRIALHVMVEFLARNGLRLSQPDGDEFAEVIERLAAGTMGEPEFIAWVEARVVTSEA